MSQSPTTNAPHRPAVSILIPAYNEAKAIRPVIDELRRDFLQPNGYDDTNSEIIVVDDGCTDGTGAQAADAGVRVITHPVNMGYGAALKTGLRHAQHETIIITDADGTYPARHLPEMLDVLATCDMVVGCRTSGAGAQNIPAIRRPAKFLLRLSAEFLAARKIPDLNSGLRAFRRTEALRFRNLYPSGFSFSTTITLAYISSDLLLRYVSIDYQPRLGKSKIRPIRDTKNLFLTVLRCALFFNPLRVCVPMALVTFALALAILFGPRDMHGNVYDGTVSVLLLGALQVLIIGFVADMMARMR